MYNVRASLLLNMLRPLAEPIFIRAPVPLPISQHIRGPGLDHTLHQNGTGQLSLSLPFLCPNSHDGGKKEGETTHSPGDMSLQPLLPLLMHRVALADLAQAIPHQELVVARREERRGHVDQDGDPAVVHVAEGLAAEEDGGHDARAQVAGEVGGDGDVGEAPDHGGVREADGERGAGRGDERVRRVETGPDDDADVGVDEEFGQEEVAEVSADGSVLVKLLHCM